jgi:hypothetical protein
MRVGKPPSPILHGLTTTFLSQAKKNTIYMGVFNCVTRTTPLTIVHDTSLGYKS